MAKKADSLPDVPSLPVVARGDAVSLPRPARREPPGPQVPRRGLSPKVRPGAYGDRHLDKAGAAFEAFVRAKGIDPGQRLPDATLNALSAEFQARPVRGHRRTGSGGDNHAANPEHLRK